MVLHSKIKAILDQIHANDSRSLHLLTPEEARGPRKNPYVTRAVNPKLARDERVMMKTIIGPFGEIPLRIYTPNEAGLLPILVYFHGGGWVLGDLDGVDTICRRIAQKARAVVVSVSYHLAPEHKFPKPVREAYFVTHWVYKHAAKWQGDPHRMAVGGDNAGANLAAAVTLLMRDKTSGPRLFAQLLLYPITNCRRATASYDEFQSGYRLTAEAMEWFIGHYLRDPSDADNPLASPLQSKDLSGLPPACIVTAEYDPLRDEGEQYAQRLREAGVLVHVKRYEGMIHDFFAFADPPWEIGEVVEAIDQMAVSFRRLLAGEEMAEAASKYL